MNIEQQTLDQLERLLAPSMEALKTNTILRNGNRFFVFDTYYIQRESHQYRIQKLTTDIGLFSNTKTALSWCIADKYGQINLAREIQQLDQHREMLSADLAVREALNNKIRDKDLSSKLETRRLKLKTIEERLDKCVNLAKYWQIRGFNNETARTGRTASNRPSR